MEPAWRVCAVELCAFAASRGPRSSFCCVSKDNRGKLKYQNKPRRFQSKKENDNKGKFFWSLPADISRNPIFSVFTSIVFCRICDVTRCDQPGPRGHNVAREVARADSASKGHAHERQTKSVFSESSPFLPPWFFFLWPLLPPLAR